MGDLISSDTKEFDAHTALGIACIERDDIERAIEEFDKALTLKPEDVGANVRLGLLHANYGQPDKAVVYYQKAISLDPLCGDASYGLACLRSSTDLSGDVERLVAALNSPGISDPDRILIGFALGRAYEGLGKYDKAFAVVDEANRRQRKSVAYSFDEDQAMFARHTSALGQKFIDHCKPCRVADETPILVLGMPRSGTSLVEQILASHPLVYGAGEVEHSRLLAEDVRKLTGKIFPQDIDSIAPQKLHDLAVDYVRRLRSNAGTASRAVDKLPHNFLRIGLFAALLPNAKIILCERDPLDNCMSIYQHPFLAGHGYAADLVELGKYYNLYREIISFWMELLPGKIFRINYEELVAHTEKQVRALLQYCELPFHEACLTFHETTRYVSSPSTMQVRSPIHGSSIDRSRNYEQHLQPLVETLAR